MVAVLWAVHWLRAKAERSFAPVHCPRDVETSQYSCKAIWASAQMDNNECCYVEVLKRFLLGLRCAWTLGYITPFPFQMQVHRNLFIALVTGQWQIPGFAVKSFIAMFLLVKVPTIVDFSIPNLSEAIHVCAHRLLGNSFSAIFCYFALPIIQMVRLMPWSPNLWSTNLQCTAWRLWISFFQARCPPYNISYIRCTSYLYTSMVAPHQENCGT